MKMKKLAVSMLSAGLVMTLGAEILKAQTEVEGRYGETNATVNFEGGNLYLNEATQNISFNSITIDSTKADNYEGTSLNDIDLKVTDSRGTGEGWKVSANLQPFEKEGQKTLRGSTIELIKGTAKQEGNGDGKGAPEVSDSVSLNEEALPVVTASRAENLDSAEGRGTWNINFKEENIKLTVPAYSVEEGEHIAKINWTLTADSTN